MVMHDYNRRLQDESLPRARIALKLRQTIPPHTWAEIGRILGVSRQRAQQLAVKAQDEKA